MMRVLELLLIVAAAVGSLSFAAPELDRGSGPSSVPPAEANAPLLQRVVLVGASVSSGFLLQTDVGAATTLADVVEAALVTEHEPVRASTSTMFFLAPLSRGGKQIDRALGYEPSLLLAIDFLFWFGYGDAENEDARLERLEQGLWLLDKVEAPIVVGDFPDMSPALTGTGMFGMPMLHPNQVPQQRTLERLNARLAGWAAERERVVVVPLAEFVASVHSGEALELRGNRWETPGTLLRDDLLHTTLEGSAGLVVLAFDRLTHARSDLAETTVRWDATEIARRTYDAKAAARKKALELKSKREKNKREREARRRAEAGEKPGDGR